MVGSVLLAVLLQKQNREAYWNEGTCATGALNKNETCLPERGKLIGMCEPSIRFESFS